MTRDPKEVVRRFFAAQDARHAGPAPELCTEDYVARLAGFPPMDRNGHDSIAAAFCSAFPDLRHSVDEVIAEDDRVAAALTITGTNTGEFMGEPATGRRIDYPALAFITIRDGLVSSMNGQFDSATIMRQLRG